MRLFFQYFFVMIGCACTGFFGLHFLFKNTAQATKPNTEVSASLNSTLVKKKLKIDKSKKVLLPPAEDKLSNSNIAIEVIKDSQFHQINLEHTVDVFSKLIRNEQASLLAKGVRKISLRSLNSERRYIEFLAFSSEETLLGSYLLKDNFSTNVPALKHMLSNMWYRNIKKSSDGLSGKLILSIKNSPDARAYVNGLPLRRLTLDDSSYVFQFRTGFRNDDKLQVAVTGENLPLVISTIDRSETHKVHKWNLPGSFFAKK